MGRKQGEGQHRSDELLTWSGVWISTVPGIMMLVEKEGPAGFCCQQISKLFRVSQQHILARHVSSSGEQQHDAYTPS